MPLAIALRIPARTKSLLSPKRARAPVRGPMKPILSARLAARADFPKNRCGATPATTAVAAESCRKRRRLAAARLFVCCFGPVFDWSLMRTLPSRGSRAFAARFRAGPVNVSSVKEFPYLSIALAHRTDEELVPGGCTKVTRREEKRNEVFNRKSPPFAKGAKNGAPSRSFVGWR